MALDGIVIANIVYEFQRDFAQGRITKIAQPEKDALLLTIKGREGTSKVLLSASATLPYACVTQKSYPSPASAPTFCMSLRKHIANGRILRVYQPKGERIILFEVEHLDELGDLSVKKLIVELMGKHSNIIFTDGEDRVIDAIKHIGPTTSSVRTVLPGSVYFVAGQSDKRNPREMTEESAWKALLRESGESAGRALYLKLTGISPLIANELCHRASVESELPVKTLADAELHRLWIQFDRLFADVRADVFTPQIVSRGEKPVEFSSTALTSYAKNQTVTVFESASEMLEHYFFDLNVYTRVRQKSADMRRILNAAAERDAKKLSLMEKQYRDTEKMEKYRICGELLQAYAHEIPQGAAFYDAFDYYTGETRRITLKPEKKPIENANDYFQRYNKLKRTKAALDVQMEEVRREIEYLSTVLLSIDIAVDEDDLNAIKEELTESGLIKKKGAKQKTKTVSEPLHFVSSDGFDIYVGKNNLQNEELTFHLASGGDYWFHAKTIPGCHVIVKTKGQELPDRTFEEAARIAGYYSSGRGEAKLEVDYVLRKELKKPPHAPKGYVIYHTNYSMVVEPVLPADPIS